MSRCSRDSNPFQKQVVILGEGASLEAAFSKTEQRKAEKAQTYTVSEHERFSPLHTITIYHKTNEFNSFQVTGSQMSVLGTYGLIDDRDTDFG